MEESLSLSLSEILYNITKLNILESCDFEDIESCGVGGKLWKSALTLCSFLDSQNLEKFANFENKTILDIGAGPGACGLFAAKKFKTKKVYITDYDPGVVQLINKNLHANQLHLQEGIDKIEIAQLDWNCREQLDTYKDNIDIIIGSDLIYSKCMIDSFIYALDYLANSETVIIIALSKRGYEGSDYDLFMEKLNLGKVWSVEIVPEEYIEQKFYNIFILVLKKNKI